MKSEHLMDIPRDFDLAYLRRTWRNLLKSEFERRTFDTQQSANHTDGCLI